MTRLMAVLLAVAVSAACASRSISRLSDDELCVYYHLNVEDPRARLAQLQTRDARSYDPEARAAADAEIRRRALIADGHWEAASAGDVHPGMSRCAVLAALGVPTKANERDDIWIYQRRGHSTLYVAFEGGNVANVWAN